MGDLPRQAGRVGYDGGDPGMHRVPSCERAFAGRALHVLIISEVRDGSRGPLGARLASIDQCKSIGLLLTIGAKLSVK